MPLYFFHVHVSGDIVRDREGRKLADRDAAFEAARTLAAQLLQSASSDPYLLKAVLFVCDEEQEIVLEFPLTEALRLEPQSDPSEGMVH